MAQQLIVFPHWHGSRVPYPPGGRETPGILQLPEHGWDRQSGRRSRRRAGQGRLDGPGDQSPEPLDCLPVCIAQFPAFLDRRPTRNVLQDPAAQVPQPARQRWEHIFPLAAAYTGSGSGDGLWASAALARQSYAIAAAADPQVSRGKNTHALGPAAEPGPERAPAGTQPLFLRRYRDDAQSRYRKTFFPFPRSYLLMRTEEHLEKRTLSSDAVHHCGAASVCGDRSCTCF